MCGLAGFNFQTENKELAEAVKNNLLDRGPDQQGQYFDQRVRLTSTRLKVQDLNAGDQPYTEPGHPWVLLYNGELYNKEELRDHLKGKNHKFITHSDTEVIYKSFLQFNVDCFTRFNGMFAIAFYNKETHDLILKTDKFGVKPLYIHEDGEKFVFSSHLSTFKVLNPNIEISRRGIVDFLKYNYTGFDHSLYKNVRRLRPESLYKINLRTLAKNEVYYEEFFKKDANLQEFGLSRLLSQAVERQLISDRRNGVFLSSGIDSSFLSAKAIIGDSELKAYNVSFKEGSYDESSLASKQAQFAGIPFEKHHFSEDTFLEYFEGFISKSDSPLADPGLFPLFFLCKKIKDSSTVLLSGDGADELFAGYPTIMATVLIQRMPEILKNPFSHALKALSPFFQSDHKGMMSYKIDRFSRQVTKDPFVAHASWRNVFSFSELSELAPSLDISEEKFNDEYLRYKPQAESLFPNDTINQLLYLDFKHWLPLNNFLKLDIATSSHSLEGRVPYLDNDLVNYLFSLNGRAKWSPFKNKPLLREECEGLVAPGVLKGSKQPFHPPYRIWFKGRMSQFVKEEILNSVLVRDYGLRTEPIEKIFKENEMGITDNTFKIYNLLYLSKWVELH